MKLLGQTGLIRLDAAEWPRAKLLLLGAGYRPRNYRRPESPYLVDAEGRYVTDVLQNGVYVVTEEAAARAGIMETGK